MWAKVLPKKTGEGVRRPYTVQYDVDGHQRERSFTKQQDAKDFKIKVLHDAHEGSFIDPKLAAGSFAEYAKTVVDGMAIASGTKRLYQGLLVSWVIPFAGSRTLAQVAGDREGATTLVNKTMTGPKGNLLSLNRRGTALGIMKAVCDEAVLAGRLPSHRLAGIDVAESGVIAERKGFVFPTAKEISLMAEEVGVAIWLMRGCGLRCREALGVSREDFRDGGATLHLSGQASEDGTEKVPLKHRRAGEFRDVPVPGYLWELIEDLPDGPVCNGAKPGAIYPTYNATYRQFVKAAKQIGLPASFTPHSLRHAFASALLTNNVVITSVANWLGHKSIEETYSTYSHLLPSAASDAKAVLDKEYAEWSAAS